MKRAKLTLRSAQGRSRDLPCTRVRTLVIGSGAAGLNAVVQLKRQGVEDVLILTEGLDKGTSINTGSDKQTYYKLSLYGEDADAPLAMAETYFAGGSMHGDLALVEASLSARAFLHRVTLGLPFPTDRYGQFVGYKTDHDPRQRATSIGPFTSQAMCRALTRKVERLAIPVREGRLAIALLALDQASDHRVGGVLALDGRGRLEAYQAENVVYATGGPGGLYRTSVYPEVHTGAIGVALLAGARGQNLPESQYGLSSIHGELGRDGDQRVGPPAPAAHDLRVVRDRLGGLPRRRDLQVGAGAPRQRSRLSTGGATGSSRTCAALLCAPPCTLRRFVSWWRVVPEAAAPRWCWARPKTQCIPGSGPSGTPTGTSSRR